MQHDEVERATAYHEAGHAVALIKLGEAVKELRIGEAAREWEGRVRPAKEDIPPMSLIKVNLAGPLAECKFWATLQKGLDPGTSFDELRFGKWPRFVEQVLHCGYDKPFPPVNDLSLQFATSQGEVFSVGVNSSGFGKDAEQAHQSAEQHGIDLSSTLEETQRMLEAPDVSKAVAALAKELLKLKTLSGQHIHSIVDGTLNSSVSEKVAWR